MDEPNLRKPLIASTQDNFPKETSLLVSSAKWLLKVMMWVVFLSWLVMILLYPAEFCDQFVRKLRSALSENLFGTTGAMFLIFSGPLMVVAILAVVYLIISGEQTFTKRKNSKYPRLKLWTFPMLVDGPFGVVSAAEFLGILVLFVFLIWAIYIYTIRNISLLPVFHVAPTEQSVLLLELTGVRLGMVGLICMAFLFLPISRGSVLLRLIDIPFEHATKYHVWLGHITMALFTLHGLCFVVGWAIQGRLAALWEWRSIGISNFPGVISLVAGLLMWITSLYPVRKHYFELFFYTHQLYVVFVVFLALHIGDFLFCITASGVFIFILDRFLRFCQSRPVVHVLSAKAFPCGTLEIVLSKPPNLRYNALSFIFLQVRELSWLQWHPFSVSSSPRDGNYHIAVLIKVLGGWTGKLMDRISQLSEAQQREQLHQLPPDESLPELTASVEGPYGHESPYHLTYENLVLVAGGIGISPFFAILSDIMNCIKEGRECLPKNVLVVWAIKKSDELSLLSTIDLCSIFPSFSHKLKLDFDIYVTRQSEPLLEDGMVHKEMSTMVKPRAHGCPMSVVVGTGDNMWSGLYVVSSTAGFIATLALLDVFYINRFNVTSWYYKGLLFVGSMVVSVVVFGGFVVALWHRWGHKASDTNGTCNGHNHNGSVQHNDSSRDIVLEDFTTIRYGTRPDFKEIMERLKGKWGGVDVGVIVCGPASLQTSVAKEIRAQSIWRRPNHPLFHFHSHSFDL